MVFITGKGIDKFYYSVFVPVGIIENILSFMVRQLNSQNIAKLYHIIIHC